ncbi:hypothetical protein WJ87_06890 [Burkholderia ubonensis]|nr:hypothetical protein WJ87_06890 [Burkholderia ubonensis]
MLMQDNLIDDDFGRQPGVRPNYDEAQAEHKRDFDSTPGELHEEHELRAREYEKNPVAMEVLSAQRGAVLVENEEDIKRIEQARAAEDVKAAQSEAEKATQRATADTTLQTPATPAGAGTSGAGGSSPGEASGAATGTADAGKSQDAAKPTSLESTLATIRMSQARERRLVISGDPAIERRFYETLATRGKLYYQGGVPVITMSRANAVKLLAEVAKEVNGASATHALSLQLNREGGNILQNFTASIKNNLPGFLDRRHEIDVVVVGTPDVVSAKLKELGSLVKDMEERRHVEKGAAAVQADGQLVVKEGKPVSLEGTDNLLHVLNSVKDKVDAYNAQRAAKAEELREFKQQKDVKAMEDAKAKADPDAAKNAKEEVNANAAKVVAQLDQGFKDPDFLHKNTGHGQVQAEVLLRQGHSFGDPSARELQTLPEKERQQAIVQFAALVAKTDDKQYDPKHPKKNQVVPSALLDQREHADTSTIREKVDAYVAMEAKRDLEFGTKAEPLLKDMVERKVLTEAQAEAISGKIAEAVTAAKEAGKAEEAAKAPAQEQTQTSDADKLADAMATAQEAAPVKDTGKDADATAAAQASTADASAAKDASKGGDAATAPAAEQTQAPDADKSAGAQATAPEAVKTADVSQATTEQREAPESRSAAAEPVAEGKAQTADTASDLAAKSGAHAAPESTVSTVTASEQKAAPEQGADIAASTAVSAAKEAATETTAPAADKPLELRDRIEALAKDGLANLTDKKADTLVSDLEGIRSKPLSALDANSGEKPTQTLVRAEALLKEVESGRFGQDLQVRAKDVADALQKWEQQDAARYGKDAALASASRDSVVAQLKSAEPALHGAAQPTRAEPASTASGTQQDAPAAKAEPARTAAAQEAPASQPQPTAAQVAREQAAQRLWETESAGAKLAGMMANPAGSFTNRDKSWNEENIQRAAREVLRIDPESVSQLSAAQRTKIAAYSAWVADNARNGKLPGFSSEEGKAMATQLVDRAAALIGKMDEGSKIPADVQKTLVKADNMVNAKEELQKTAALGNEAERGVASRNAISPAAARSLANDMVHSVFRQPEVREAQVKYLLKNAANLTPESIKSLEPQDRAKTAVAIDHLAKQVQEGAMGDFSKLPSSVQKNVVAATKAADALLNSMSNDPAMRAELNQAYNELHGKSAGAARGADASAAKPAASEHSSGSKSAEQSAAKSEGRSLDR